MSRRQEGAGVRPPTATDKPSRKPKQPKKTEGPGTETRPLDLRPPTLVPLSEAQRRQAVSALAQLLLPLLMEDGWRDRAA